MYPSVIYSLQLTLDAIRSFSSNLYHTEQKSTLLGAFFGLWLFYHERNMVMFVFHDLTYFLMTY
jgi:hypothetical protein